MFQSVKLNINLINIQWSFISLVTSSILHLLLRAILGRELGADGLGTYTLVFTIYMFGIQFSAFGMDATLAKYISEHNNIQKTKELLSSGIVVSLITSLMMSTLLYLAAETISINFFHNSEMSYLLKITSICFPFIAIQKTIVGTFNGLHKMNYVALIEISHNLLIASASLYLVMFLKLGIKGAVIGLVAPTILIGLVSLILDKKLLISEFKNYVTLKQLFVFGFYIVLANSIGLINTQVDSLLIGHFMDKVEVGYYSISVMIMQVFTLFPQSIQRVTSPLISQLHGMNDYLSIKKLIKRTLAQTYSITIIISLFVVIFGKHIISHIFTESFLPAYTPMLILLIGYSICAPMGSIGGALASTGKVKIIFKISIVCACMNTLLNIILIPKFGIVGAASATSISLIVTFIIQMSLIQRYILKYSSERE